MGVSRVWCVMEAVPPPQPPRKMPWWVCWQCWVIKGVGTLRGTRHPTCMKEEVASVLCEAAFGYPLSLERGGRAQRRLSIHLELPQCDRAPHPVRNAPEEGGSSRRWVERQAGGRSQGASQARIKNLELRLLKGFCATVCRVFHRICRNWRMLGF